MPTSIHFLKIGSITLLIAQIETDGLRDLLRSPILINLVWGNSKKLNILISNKKEIKLYQNTIRSLNIVLREDGAVSDLGYPVATELEDSRIFTAYYYIINNCNDC